MKEERKSFVDSWRAMEERFDEERRSRRHADALHSQAQQFRRARDNPDKASRYLGVTRSRDKWVASIRRTDAKVACSLGTYANEREAAVAYDIMALALFGDEVRTNMHPAKYKPIRTEWTDLIAAGLSSHQFDRKAARKALRILVMKLTRSSIPSR